MSSVQPATSCAWAGFSLRTHAESSYRSVQGATPKFAEEIANQSPLQETSALDLPLRLRSVSDFNSPARRPGSSVSVFSSPQNGIRPRSSGSRLLLPINDVGPWPAHDNVAMKINGNQ